jgi:thioredoxin-related protein
MKKLLLIALTMIFGLNLKAEDHGITFTEGNWAGIIAKATKENKYIFVDCFTTWCGPCKWLAKNIFPKQEVGDFYNTNFVSVEIDMEKGEGIELAKTWSVRAYPSLIFFNSKGELVHRSCGVDYRDDFYKDFIKLGKNAMDPNEQMSSIKKKVDGGNADAKTKAKYISLLASAYLDYSKELADYMTTQKDEDLLQRYNWDLLFSLNSAYDSKEVKFLVANREKFAKLYTADSVNMKLANVYSTALMMNSMNPELYEKIKADLNGSGIKESDKIILKADLFRYKNTKDWTSYAKTAITFTDKYSMSNASELNAMAWNFYEKVEDKELLSHAEGWARHAVELDPNYANTDTYAAVLFKLGKVDEAKKQAQIAIDLAKKENADYKETQDLLNKMNGIK